MLDKVDIKIEIDGGFKMDLPDITLSQLSIFVGANGSGKTFFFKYLWYVSYALQMYKTVLHLNMEGTEDLFKENAEKLFGYVFEEGEKISGVVTLTDKEKEIYRFRLKIENGKLVAFDLTVHNPEKFKIGEIQPVRYASKNTRGFEEVERYTMTKKLMNMESGIANEKDLDKICQLYKIYDVFFLEDILSKMARWTANPESFKEEWGAINIIQHLDDLIVSDDLSDLKALILEEDIPYLLMGDGKTIRLSNLSSGSQALIMLTVFSR
jgi:predicted ATP-binding protein involved in virulence